MILHHLATVALYGGMIVNNAINPGSTIAFVFMIADVPVTFVKFFSQTHLDNCTAVSFFVLLPCWFWTRLVVVPWFTYSVYLFYSYPAQFESYNLICQIKCIMMLLLCFLNFFWFGMFLRLGYRYIKKGHTEDPHDIQMKGMKVKKDK